MLSHPGSVGSARSLGWSLGGLLRSCLPEPTFLIRGAILRLPRVAPVSRTGAPGEGRLTEVWPGASGHARWRNEMVRRGNHHYSEGRQRLWAPPPVVSWGPTRAALSPCQRVLLPKPLPQDKGSWRPVACADPISDGTPVRRRGVLGAHVPGHRHGSDPGGSVGGPPRVPGGRAPRLVSLEAKAAPRAG